MRKTHSEQKFNKKINLSDLKDFFLNSHKCDDEKSVKFHRFFVTTASRFLT